MLRVEHLSYALATEATPHTPETSLWRALSFSLGARERLAICGPSGSGKTTLLKLIAGLIPLQKGRLYWDDQDISTLSAHLRGFVLVFQEHALFDHLNVAENIAFAPKVQGLGAAEVNERLRSSLAALELEHLAQRAVWQLSGGQQQRVALARALAAQPRLLLLDEPFANLDSRLRARTRQHVLQVLDQLHAPCILVSHDSNDIASLCHRSLTLEKPCHD